MAVIPALPVLPALSVPLAEFVMPATSVVFDVSGNAVQSCLHLNRGHHPHEQDQNL
jgi:hypothetical protein